MCFSMFFPMGSLQRNSLDILQGETYGEGQASKGIQGLKMTIVPQQEEEKHVPQTTSLKLIIEVKLIMPTV